MLLRELISEAWSDKYKRSINCSNPKGFSQRAHCQGRNKQESSVEEGDLIPWPKGTVKVDVGDVYDWYKLGMNISDLDDANPADFGKGPPQTVLAFGSEPLEHEYIKNLSRLGMKTHDIDEETKQIGYAPNLMEIFERFLPIAMRVLAIKKLPRIKLHKHINDQEQPTFGRFLNDDVIIDIGIADRHPNDILRTLAHELAHYKQLLDKKLGPHSGDTGSPEENEAHAKAGIIMRHFNKRYPQYLSAKPLSIQEAATAGATTAGSIASIPNPHYSPGPARGKKSYTGSPGKSGTKAPPQPKPMKQTPGTNALDMKGVSLFGAGTVKR